MFYETAYSPVEINRNQRIVNPIIKEKSYIGIRVLKTDVLQNKIKRIKRIKK